MARLPKIHPEFIDPMPVRKVNLAFNEKIECAYPDCRKQFVPWDKARHAYQKKGYCFCHEHQNLVATYMAIQRAR